MSVTHEPTHAVAPRPGHAGTDRHWRKDQAGALLLRRLLPAALATVVAGGVLARAGAGTTGTTLVATALGFAGLGFWVSRVLDRRDARSRAEHESLAASAEACRRALAASEERFATLARNLPNGAILIFDEELRYDFADGAELLGFLGFRKDDLVGRRLEEVASPEGRALGEPLYRRALKGESNRAEIGVRGRTVALHTSPVRRADGTITGGMALLYDITSLKRAEEAMRRSEEQLRVLLDALPDLVVVNRDGRIAYANAAVAKSLGYGSTTELINLPISSLVPDSDRPAFEPLVRLALEGQAGRTPIEVRRLRRDGSICLLESIALPVLFEGRPAILAVGRDVTERRKAEAAAREASALWRAILDSTSYSIVATTPDGTIRELNAAAERLLGYRAEELVGKANPAIIHDPEEVVARSGALSRELGVLIEPGFETFVARARRGLPDESEWTYIRKDGSRFPVRVSVTALRDPSGEIRGFLGIGKDITAECESRSELVRAKDAALEAVRARADFLARMSHEIRTPMNGIMGMNALLLRTSLDDEQHDYVASALDSARDLLATLNDILDFSKIDAGKMTLESVPFAPRDCLERALQVVSVPAREKPLRLDGKVAPAVPPLLRGDPHRLGQVLTNLLANGVKFTPEGSVTASIDVVGPRTAGAVTLELAVTDTGIGVPVDKQGLIFEPFRQADETTARCFGGTGLGLAISSELVKAMGGRLQLESTPGKGSRFHFRITLPVIDAGARASDPTDERGPVPRALRPLRVLVVEDNPVNLKLTVNLLRAAGHEPTVTTDGRQALAALEINPYEVVLMDVRMPGMDGLEATRALRQRERERGGHLTVIGLTAQAMSGDREECLAAGMDEYLAKPFDPSALLALLDSVPATTCEGADRPSVTGERRHS